MSLYRYIYAFLAVMLLSISCVREEIFSEDDAWVGDEIVSTGFAFAHSGYDNVSVTTRATLNVVPESRVQNMFVFIFVGEKRVYAHFFDNKELLGSVDDVKKETSKNCWTVSNLSASDDASSAESTTPTNGYVRLMTPEFEGGDMYIVANVDADMVNISPEQLNTMRTRTDIENLTATLNQEITSRNGYFPMTAKVSEVKTGTDGLEFIDDVPGAAPNVIYLERLDAKVQVYVRVATGYKTQTELEGGNVQTQTLKEFVPESWRVVNLPKGTYAIGRSQDFDASGYFSTEPVTFETSESKTFTCNMNGASQEVTSDYDGFSFYMLENREESKNTVGDNFHLRDMRSKDPSTGEYLKESGDMWEYAPADGTYIEIVGDLKMDVDESNDAKQQQLMANVKYYIHLGDIANDLDDYSIERNTHYTYTITIKGVNKIELEVTSSEDMEQEKVKEEESGATGGVYVAREEIYTYDAHYGQRVYAFDAAYIDPDKITWFVQTPFGKVGTPLQIGGVDVPSGMDYKWVHFVVNKFNDEPDAYTGAETYSRNNRAWPGHPDDGFDSDAEKALWKEGGKVMDVVEFTKFIKEQTLNLKAGYESAFRKEFDEDWFEWYNENRGPSITKDVALAELDGIWYRNRIYVTVFVDEYYYDEDPISGEKREGLWKEFVNQPNRLMHLLCDNHTSLDGESSSTGSVVTIRQRSIQTPFNITKPALMTAWGCETVDETFEGQLLFYDKSQENDPKNMGNTSQTNGLFNTAKLLGVSDDPGMVLSDYLDYDRVNDYHNSAGVRSLFLRDDYISMLYSILMRNRDEDGDGYLEAGELKWYIASINQLYALYMGSLGLNAEAMLYSASRAAMKGKYESGNFNGAAKWRSHIVSSTKDNTDGKTNYPIELWGEEGVAISYYKRYNTSKPSPYSIRCVRNLGLDAGSFAELSSVEPEKLIKYEQNPDTKNYLFDLSNINDKSVRFYTTRELEPSDEHSEMSRVYYGFETGDRVATGQYLALKADLDAGKSPCPEGWRVPNVREGALMALYCSSDWWKTESHIIVGSYYSNGTLGNRNDTESPSWRFGYKHASIALQNETGTRCVRDYLPPSMQ